MFTKNKSDEQSKVIMSEQNANLAQSIRQSNTRSPKVAGPSLISSDMKFKGTVVSEGEIQIDGQIEGDVKANALTIGESGKIIGEISSETIIVRGQVIGSIRAKKIQLAANARVEGDITHASLSIEASAIFEGQVKHKKDPLGSGNAKESTVSKPAAAPRTSPATARSTTENTSLPS